MQMERGEGLGTPEDWSSPDAVKGPPFPVIHTTVLGTAQGCGALLWMKQSSCHDVVYIWVGKVNAFMS